MQGVAHFLAGRYDEAVFCLERSPTTPLWLLAYLAASYAQGGQSSQATDYATRLLAQEPRFSILRFLAKEPLHREVDRRALADGLSRAGIPE